MGKVFAYSSLDFVEGLRPGLAFFSVARTFLHRAELLFPMSPQGTAFLTVHPVPLPTSTEAKLDESNSKDDDNRNRILFNHRNAVSGAPVRIRTNRLPNPPVIASVTGRDVVKEA